MTDELKRAQEAMVSSAGTRWGQYVHFDADSFHAVLALVKQARRQQLDTREPSVAEAARVLMQSKVARDAAFDAMWRVSEKHSLEATNRAGARYSITGDVVNEIWYAALRAQTEGGR